MMAEIHLGALVLGSYYCASIVYEISNNSFSYDNKSKSVLWKRPLIIP